MKEFLFYVALVLAFIGAFIWGYYRRQGTPNEGPLSGIDFFCASFFFWLLSMAPFIH